MSARQPNIVLINCDDLGYGDLGCYGSDVHDTPAIDALAAEGARFTDFSMASPVCSPSRAAMLTGSYPLRIGFGGDGLQNMRVLFPGQGRGLHPDEVTIARVLSDAGYATLAVGKWHCGDQPDFLPTNHGFDEWFGLPYSNDMGVQLAAEGTPTRDELNARIKAAGIDFELQWPPLPLVDMSSGNAASSDDADTGVVNVTEQQPDQATLTGRYVERSVDFIRSNADNPFFLYLAHMYVHVPIYVEQRFADASRNGAYGAAVASIDWATEVMIAELERLGIADDTIVIFTSDNGALAPGPDGSGSNAPLRDAKGTTWEGGQRVPCIVRWPGHIAEGLVVNEMASALDLLPTLAEVCGARAPHDRTLDGHDIGGLLGLSDTAPDADRSFLSMAGGNIEAIRVGRWKLHVRKARQEMSELYDLVADIGETADRATEHPDIVADLTARIEAARIEFGDQATGVAGVGTRPIGRVEHPVTLSSFDDPSTIAEYDLPYRG